MLSFSDARRTITSENRPVTYFKTHTFSVTDLSFHVMHSIVIDKYSALYQGKCPSLGFTMIGFHSLTTCTLIDIVNSKADISFTTCAATRPPEGAYLLPASSD